MVGVLTLAAGIWWLGRDQHAKASQSDMEHEPWNASGYARIAGVSVAGGILSGMFADPGSLSSDNRSEVQNVPACFLRQDA